MLRHWIFASLMNLAVPSLEQAGKRQLKAGSSLRTVLHLRGDSDGATRGLWISPPDTTSWGGSRENTFVREPV